MDRLAAMIGSAGVFLLLVLLVLSILWLLSPILCYTELRKIRKLLEDFEQKSEKKLFSKSEAIVSPKLSQNSEIIQTQTIKTEAPDNTIIDKKPPEIKTTGIYHKMVVGGVVAMLSSLGGCTAGVLYTASASSWLIFGAIGVVVGYVVFITGRNNE